MKERARGIYVLDGGDNIKISLKIIGCQGVG
jgi:hypothetical protein